MRQQWAPPGIGAPTIRLAFCDPRVFSLTYGKDSHPRGYHRSEPGKGLVVPDPTAASLRYAADARAQMVPLVSPFGGAPGHDWNYLLGTLGLLGRDQVIRGTFHVAGILTMGAGLLGAVWVLRVMARVNEADPALDLTSASIW